MDNAQSLENGSSSDNDRLIIIGSGSTALKLYKIAVIFGYNITVMDNRGENLTRKRFPKAGERLRGDVVQLLRDYDITARTSIIIVNHNRELDEGLLQVAIQSKARYIGVLGNSRKTTDSLIKLKATGLEDKLIERVHIPVGLGLSEGRGTDTALAAMAEINSRFRKDTIEAPLP
ncbi:MAG: XdhC family protein [Syntrophomonadaceae bacterium]|nr:XdhC family protein [Syntrophomonadaceae bacterium]